MSPTHATLITISVSVIAVILVLVLIALIPVLLQVRRTAKEAEKLIDSVRLQVSPISRDVSILARDVRNIVQSIHRQVDRVEDGVETAHGMAVRLKAFQEEVCQKIEEPLLQVAAILGGVKHGIETVAKVFCR